MNSKIKLKLSLLMVVVCTTIIFFMGYKSEEQRCETTGAVSEDVIVETKEEVIESPKSNQTEKTTEKTVDKIVITKKSTKKIAEKTKSESSDSCVDRNVPINNTIKSYMDYRCITLTTSKQYKLQNSIAYTGDYGIRMVNGRYCVALGSYYTTTIGQYIDVELENGNVIKAILADCKADKDTNSTNKMHPDGSVVEFVVDTRVLNSTAREMGDLSYVNGWNSKVVNIKVYDIVEEF